MTRGILVLGDTMGSSGPRALNGRGLDLASQWEGAKRQVWAEHLSVILALASASFAWFT
jgi:hypothetical protein